MEKWERVERAYRLLVAVGRALLQAPGEAELAQEICRCAVEVAGYRLAWVGYADRDAPYAVRPVAHYGFDDGYLASARVAWDESERGSGPTGRAVRTGLAQVAQNIAGDPRVSPWREDALSRGYASSAALPLVDDGVTWGALNVYATEPDAFDAEELELLDAVAADLTHGILAARGKHELSRLQTRLARLERIDAFARATAIHAHDMNNHLHVVRVCLDLLEKGGDSGSARVLHDAQAALERAIGLNRIVLDLARSGREAESVFEVNAALRGLEGELERMIGDRNRLVISSAAPGVRVRMARTGFVDLVCNLVANARDAMPDGGVVTIELRPTRLEHPLSSRWLGGRPGAYVALCVRDTGHGIPKEIRDRIFDPFFTTKAERGTGLGLASAYAVVKQARGFIAVDTEPGRGSTFEVLLPVEPTIADDLSAEC